MLTRSAHTPPSVKILDFSRHPEFLQKFHDWVCKSLNSWNAIRTERAALKQLATLDDRELRDIGITREDVIHVQRQSPANSPTASLNDIARRRNRNT